MSALLNACSLTCTNAVALASNHHEQIGFDVTTNRWFEGDLNIPVEMIMEHYNFSSHQEREEMMGWYLGSSNRSAINATETAYNSNRRKRAVSSVANLWPDGIVKYRISPTMNANGINNIHSAMKHFENTTCIKFVLADGAADYVEFITSGGDGCYSSSVGKQRGRQVINLGSLKCQAMDVIIHEIAHAIGFWHEQSRPDRDNYVRIHWDRIKKGKGLQFLKRNSFKVDSQSSPYDYNSIMHYSTEAFPKPGCHGDGCVTISISNAKEYNKQGSPELGSSRRLSTEDILQTNRLYSCAPSIRGFLSMYVKYGKDLRQADGRWDLPDPYVSLIAVDSRGSQHYHKTVTIQNSQNPTWNELLLFGEGHWQLFRLTAWDEDRGGKDKLTETKTFPVAAGCHANLKLCENIACRNFVELDYKLDIRPLYTGSLIVYIRYAHDLADTDPIWNQPDPYTHVEAIQSNAVSVQKRTRTISGTRNPTWNRVFGFVCTSWNSLLIQINDEDLDADDFLSDSIWIFVNPGHHSDNKLTFSQGGYLIYNYNFIVDGNECSPNPCRNGGTCQDGCSRYSCSCPAGFSGHNCQFMSGNLRVTARYGQNWPDNDGLWNDSDPYMEFIAIDRFGRSVRMASRIIGGNHDPEWNQVLNFGSRAWRVF